MKKFTDNDLKQVLTTLSKLNLDEMFTRENISKWKAKQKQKQ